MTADGTSRSVGGGGASSRAARDYRIIADDSKTVARPRVLGPGMHRHGIGRSRQQPGRGAAVVDLVPPVGACPAITEWPQRRCGRQAGGVFTRYFDIALADALPVGFYHDLHATLNAQTQPQARSLSLSPPDLARVAATSTISASATCGMWRPSEGSVVVLRDSRRPIGSDFSRVAALLPYGVRLPAGGTWSENPISSHQPLRCSSAVAAPDRRNLLGADKLKGEPDRARLHDRVEHITRAAAPLRVERCEPAPPPLLPIRRIPGRPGRVRRTLRVARTCGLQQGGSFPIPRRSTGAHMSPECLRIPVPTGGAGGCRPATGKATDWSTSCPHD